MDKEYLTVPDSLRNQTNILDEKNAKIAELEEKLDMERTLSENRRTSLVDMIRINNEEGADAIEKMKQAMIDDEWEDIYGLLEWMDKYVEQLREQDDDT